MVSEVRSGPQSFWGRSGPPRPSRIEYRLIREGIVREFRRGRLSRPDVCDAQPELLRVARNLGRQTETECPICEQAYLVHASFAFGPGLPAQGRALASGDMTRLPRNGEISCYVVEVCTECSWNHLLRMFTVGSEAANRKR